MNLNTLRNKVLDTVIKVADKAKAKPPSTGHLIEMINDANLSDHDKLNVLKFLQTEIDNDISERNDA